MAWDDPLHSPLEIAGRTPLVTVRDAGEYVAALPKREQAKPHWQLAAQCLLLKCDDGPDPFMVGAAMRQALNHGKPEPAKEPRRKRARVYRIVR